jgi:plasmid stabilization system protein ParE
MPKKFRVEITETAEEDIAGIWNYIARDSFDAATNFILRFEKQIDSLETFPARCPMIPENDILGTKYRHFIYGAYRAILKISGPRVIIMRVIHGARLLDMDMLEG